MFSLFVAKKLNNEFEYKKQLTKSTEGNNLYEI